MAGGAYLRILPPHAVRVEAGAVRVEPPTPERRVTRETVALNMTADTRFKTLTRCLTVAEQEEPFRVVKPRPEDSVGDQPRL